MKHIIEDRECSLEDFVPENLHNGSLVLFEITAPNGSRMTAKVLKITDDSWFFYNYQLMEGERSEFYNNLRTATSQVVSDYAKRASRILVFEVPDIVFPR